MAKSILYSQSISLTILLFSLPVAHNYCKTSTSNFPLTLPILFNFAWGDDTYAIVSNFSSKNLAPIPLLTTFRTLELEYRYARNASLWMLPTLLCFP